MILTNFSKFLYADIAVFTGIFGIFVYQEDIFS